MIRNYVVRISTVKERRSGLALPPRHRSRNQQLFEDNASILVIRRRLRVKKRESNENRTEAMPLPCEKINKSKTQGPWG